jgi:RNA polymerase sigma-70 factor (ECF subfamily)
MPMNAVADVSREPDAQDFEAIFRQLSPMVYRTARSLTGRPEEAEDIVQAIFLKLIERELPVVFRKDPRAYLYRAAVNMSLDVLRSRRRFAFTHEVEGLESPSAVNPVFDGDTIASFVRRSGSSVPRPCSYWSCATYTGTRMATLPGSWGHRAEPSVFGSSGCARA